MGRHAVCACNAGSPYWYAADALHGHSIRAPLSDVQPRQELGFKERRKLSPFFNKLGE